MFPEETHIKIVQRINDLEAKLFGIYRGLESLRLDLQNYWHVLPSGSRWTEANSEATRYSAQGDNRCVCQIEDGLVQEWVFKARAVAKNKGL